MVIRNTALALQEKHCKEQVIFWRLLLIYRTILISSADDASPTTISRRVIVYCAQRYLRSPAQSPFGVLLLRASRSRISKSYGVDNHSGTVASGYWFLQIQGSEKTQKVDFTKKKSERANSRLRNYWFVQIQGYEKSQATAELTPVLGTFLTPFWVFLKKMPSPYLHKTVHFCRIWPFW